MLLLNGAKVKVRSYVSDACSLGEDGNMKKSEVKLFRKYFDDGCKIC